MSKSDSQDPIAERDRRIESLERKLAKEAANRTAMEALTAKVSELEAESEIQRIEYELKLAGCRSVKDGRALLDDYDGDVDALKEAEPWLFADAPRQAAGRQDRAPQRRHQHGRRQDHVALAQVRRPGRFQRQRLGGPRHGQ